MRRAIADWSACGVAVAILALGGLVVIKPAVDHWDDLYRGDPFDGRNDDPDRAEDVRQEGRPDADHRDGGLVVVPGAAARRQRRAAVPARAGGAGGVPGCRAVAARDPRRVRPPAQRDSASRGGSRPSRTGRSRPIRPTANGRTANGVEDSAGATLAPGIAKLVAARRETLGLSQRELAKRAGISHTVISRIEGGEHSPSPKTLERLADALS